MFSYRMNKTRPKMKDGVEDSADMVEASMRCYAAPTLKTRRTPRTRCGKEQKNRKREMEMAARMGTRRAKQPEAYLAKFEGVMHELEAGGPVG